MEPKTLQTDTQTKTLVISDVDALIDHIEAEYYVDETASDEYDRRVVVDEWDEDGIGTARLTKTHQNTGVPHPSEAPAFGIRPCRLHNDSAVRRVHPSRADDHYLCESDWDWDEEMQLWRDEMRASLHDRIHVRGSRGERENINIRYGGEWSAGKNAFNR